MKRTKLLSRDRRQKLEICSFDIKANCITYVEFILKLNLLLLIIRVVLIFLKLIEKLVPIFDEKRYQTAKALNNRHKNRHSNILAGESIFDKSFANRFLCINIITCTWILRCQSDHSICRFINGFWMREKLLINLHKKYWNLC